MTIDMNLDNVTLAVFTSSSRLVKLKRFNLEKRIRLRIQNLEISNDVHLTSVLQLPPSNNPQT